jgi:virginiamycin A acetyltransferase
MIPKFITNSIRLFFFRRNWRRINLHNSTVPKNVFSTDVVTVGKMSYGELSVKVFSPSTERLIIGDYVSIAHSVVFILGGNHQLNTVTTYPLYSKLVAPSPERDAQSRGAVVVEDEVWIGFGSMILSGVTIGKGAVIAAGSVVVNDIPPYAVAGGNPARVITQRFDEDTRNKLLQFSISQLDPIIIKDNIDDFYKPLNIELLTKIMNYSKEDYSHDATKIDRGPKR